MPKESTITKPISKINNVSTRNISIISKYVENKLGNSVLLTSNLNYTKEYLLSEHNWIPLATYNEIMNRAISLLNDPHAPYKMGLSALELESWGLFKYIRQIFLTLVVDPSIVYKKVSEYNPLFNNTKDFHLVSSSKTHTVFKISFKEDVDPVEDFHSDKYIQGILASIPQIWDLPSSEVRSIANQYDIVELLHRVGGVPRHKMEYRDNLFLVNGEVVGKKINNLVHDSSWVQMVKQAHKVSDESIFESLKHDSKKNKTTPVIITKHLQVSDLVTLYLGEVYNAPHFIYHISWEKPSFGTHLKHMLFQRWKSRTTYQDAIVASLSTMKDYTATLEQKVIDRTHELELARTESEYWRKKADELLATMLPEHIARTMVEKRLEPQELHGTVIYTDIVGFTEYSKNHDRVEVDEELGRYFAEITNIANRHGGWVNKFLGDGMLIIFGLRDTEEPLENAVRAARQIVNNLNKYSWGTRVSVTTGPFTIGEYGNGELRRFDCVGNTLNLGSRLQSHAGVNEIIVCETTYNELLKTNNHTFGPKKDLQIKGIGDVIAYPLR